MSLLSLKAFPKFVMYPMIYSALFSTDLNIFAWKDR